MGSTPAGAGEPPVSRLRQVTGPRPKNWRPKFVESCVPPNQRTEQLDGLAAELWSAIIRWCEERELSALPLPNLADLWIDEASFGRLVRDGMVIVYGHWVAINPQCWRMPTRCRPTIPLELRLAVYQRDDWRCVHCGARKPLSLDHIYPYSRGGLDTFENLQTLCRPCNSAKGARLPDGGC